MSEQSAETAQPVLRVDVLGRHNHIVDVSAADPKEGQ